MTGLKIAHRQRFEQVAEALGGRSGAYSERTAAHTDPSDDDEERGHTT